MKLLAIIFALAACGGSLPETRYYSLAPAPKAASSTHEGAVIAVEPLETDAGYDDERIVYRTTPYRLDYYQYHRWSASPGTLVSSYLEQALERSGQFAAVTRDVSERSPAVLGGRVVAIEEVDESPTRWLGRIVIELRLTDARTGDVLWTQQFEETEPLPAQTPEGLAQALSKAMARIAATAAPTLATLSVRLRDNMPATDEDYEDVDVLMPARASR
jgi:ABC-type uncharacterized transport system auxiliary subunit